MRYELVIFDLGGVTVEVAVERLVGDVATLLGQSKEEVRQAVCDEQLLLPFELGRIKAPAYYAGLKARLDLTWTYDEFVRAWNGIFTENQHVTWLMQRLRKRHKLIALSNTNELHLAHIKSTMPSLAVLHDWVASCEVGFMKPDPQIYRLALERMRIRPEAAVYIDDRADLIQAGQAVGLTSIQFRDNQQLEDDLRRLGVDI